MTKKYSKSFVAIFIILIIGFIIEFFSASAGASMPSSPINLIILVFFIVYLIITYTFFKKTEIIEWFTSIPATIAVISAYTLLTIIMGFIAQQPHNHFIDKIGLTHIKNSYPFVMVSIVLLMILGYITIKRMSQKFSLRNIAFFMNHGGLFIVIAAGSLGTGDMVRLSIPVSEGETTNIAFDNKNNMYQLPFEIELQEFNIEQYPPELILYNKQTGYPIIKDGDKLPFIEKGKTGKIHTLDYEIIEYYPFAAATDTAFIDSERFGTVHAAQIILSDESKSITGWISTENFMHNANFVFFGDKYVIGMVNPKVFKYQSHINIRENNNLIDEDILIEVNKPHKHAGWKIYQNSYDSRFDRWSETSIFEVIKDPWLPVVYIGIYMLIIGSVYLIYVGRQMNVRD